MVVSLMGTLAAILLGQLDAVALHPVDGADVRAVRTDDLHVRFDLGHCGISMSRTNALRRQMFIRIEEFA
jgi:hypothetical protein